MRIAYRFLLASAVLSFSVLVEGQGRAEVTINDAGVQAENLTSGQDGTIYFGSTAKGTIYRAAPGAVQAEPWILASTTGLTNVLGLLADDKTGTLWVCQNSTGGRNGAPVAGQTALRSFDIKSGAAKGTYPFPVNGGFCNDMAIGADGTVYATETFNNRVNRLRPGASAVEIWIADEQLAAIDGIAVLGDGAVYVNTFFTGHLLRIPVRPDGRAGAIVAIATSLPLSRPDGLRSTGPNTLIQAEGQGRVAELTVSGSKADVRVLREGLTGATGVTVVDGTAFVLVERTKAVAVPYMPRAQFASQPRQQQQPAAQQGRANSSSGLVP